jgi:hypothetical protein
LSTTSSFKATSHTTLSTPSHSAAALELAALRNVLLSGVHLSGPKTAFHHSQVHGGTTV